jgi:hypothetical protein
MELDVTGLAESQTHELTILPRTTGSDAIAAEVRGRQHTEKVALIRRRNALGSAAAVTLIAASAATLDKGRHNRRTVVRRTTSFFAGGGQNIRAEAATFWTSGWWRWLPVASRETALEQRVDNLGATFWSDTGRLATCQCLASALAAAFVAGQRRFVVATGETDVEEGVGAFATRVLGAARFDTAREDLFRRSPAAVFTRRRVLWLIAARQTSLEHGRRAHVAIGLVSAGCEAMTSSRVRRLLTACLAGWWRRRWILATLTAVTQEHLDTVFALFLSETARLAGAPDTANSVLATTVAIRREGTFTMT